MIRIKIFLLLFFITFLTQAQEYNIPILTALPVDVKQEQLDLNGQWQFDTNPTATFWSGAMGKNVKTIQVPGQWIMQGFNVPRGQVAGYHRTFKVPASYGGKRLKLRCNGVFSESTVYINGKQVGGHLGGFTPFELDISDAVHFGADNSIAIAVRSETLADSLASASKYAVHNLGGISRDIFIFAVANTNISSFHVTTNFDATYTDAVVHADIEVLNQESKSVDNLIVSFTLLDPSGKKVALLNKNEHMLSPLHSQANEKITFPLQVKAPRHWTSETPHLYTLIAELKHNQTILHRTLRKVGFRELKVQGNELLVNGKPIKLRGVNRHEVMPLRGRSLTGDIWIQDVKLFRAANINYIRTSHYPPDEKLLDACDELGMFVEVEAPFCWAHETKVPTEKKYNLLVNQHIEMVNRDKSHPSIIMWSLGNESLLYKEYFKKAGEIIQKMDPSRPRIFSQWSPEADDGELEITNHHYPGPTGPNKYKESKRPVVFDEYIHINSYNRFELAADPGVRDMWGVLLDRMWTDMYYSKGVLGGAIWAGIDDTFFLPDGKVVGYGTWGPIDGWRREKPEYWNVKKAYSPVRISQVSNLNAYDKVEFDIENRHNFTNILDCKVVWKWGVDSGILEVDVQPRQRGSFAIDLNQAERSDAPLYIKVTSPLGFVIDEYLFAVKPTVEEPESRHKVKWTTKKIKEGIEISTNNRRYIINENNGSISICNQKQEKIITKVPSLMLLPLNSEGRGIQMVGDDPNFEPYNVLCSNWVAERIALKQSTTKNVEIEVSGKYAEAKGKYTYVFSEDGSWTVSYDFTLLKDMVPRQIGLVFELPKEFDELSWKRKGYWNFYPEQHLGALHGVAKAYNSQIPVSGSAGPSEKPFWSWSEDQTAAGTNLFRATKQNVTSAVLSTSDGRMIALTGDGSQHVRTWRDTTKGVTMFLVADYINAGREGFLESHAQADYKRLKRSDNVRGSVTLKLQ